MKSRLAGMRSPLAGMRSPLATMNGPLAGRKGPLAGMYGPLAGIRTSGARVRRHVGGERTRGGRASGPENRRDTRRSRRIAVPGGRTIVPRASSTRHAGPVAVPGPRAAVPRPDARPKIGRAQYRSRRCILGAPSRTILGRGFPTRSVASMRTVASREKPPPCSHRRISAAASGVMSPRRAQISGSLDLGTGMERVILTLSVRADVVELVDTPS